MNNYPYYYFIIKDLQSENEGDDDGKVSENVANVSDAEEKEVMIEVELDSDSGDSSFFCLLLHEGSIYFHRHSG
jgi:hypothetical protein